MSTIEQRVQRGAVLLDQLVPDWFSRINLEKLDIGTCVNCILGQLFGSYTRGLDCLRVKSAAAQFRLVDDSCFGFTELIFEDEEDPADRLNQAWRDEIQERVSQLVAVSV